MMQNSRKNRKDNGLFFVSLIIAIVAFYIILSLENQGVIVYLRTMESDAVDKLFLLIPALYAMSLFILFFLVYFAGKYQLERRSHELGMYLVLGMKRSKLLLMLFMEELWNSVLSLAAGISLAVLLSEFISLITVKVVGIGIIGHEFTFAWSAVKGTILGYFIIRICAICFLSIQFTRRDLMQLLSDSQEEKSRKKRLGIMGVQWCLGVFLLVVAYAKAMDQDAMLQLQGTLVILVAGILGTGLLFRGLGIFFEVLLKKRGKKNGLGMFTFRQLQETVFLKPLSLTVSSLLLLMAFCCFGYGISVFFTANQESHSMDYTFAAEADEVNRILDALELAPYVNETAFVQAGNYHMETEEMKFSATELMDAISQQEESNNKDILLNNLQYFEYPYLISLDGYNAVLEMMGKEPIVLQENEVAFYSDPEFAQYDYMEVLAEALQSQIHVEFGKERYAVQDTYYKDSIVTDRFLTIGMGFIVPEEVFENYTSPKNINSFYNLTLEPTFVEKKGLMQAMEQVNQKLDTTKLRYESYLQNMGRELFYRVAASYTTVYLAVIFLLIANTVVGVQFLMHQQKAKHRYQSLIHLGATDEMLCGSARTQINWYFLLPLTVAFVSSFFGIKVLFRRITTTAMQSEGTQLILGSVLVLVFLCVIELCYVIAVKKASDHNIETLRDVKRTDS